MTLPSFSLEGKVAFLTGARRGIGRAIANCYAEAGADVVVCDRVGDSGELDEVVEELRRHGRRALGFAVDITRRADIESAVQKTTVKFGRIDILLNGAAMNIAVPLLELREEGIDKIINTNLKGYYLCTQAVGRVMVEQKSGVIVNMSSAGAEKAAPNMSVYHSCKAGVNMLTQSLALEWAPYNVRVNGIGPSMIETKFSEPLWKDPAARRDVENTVPMRRLGTPDDITGAALYLASDASKFVTGHTLYVDGGLLA